MSAHVPASTVCVVAIESCVLAAPASWQSVQRSSGQSAATVAVDERDSSVWHSTQVTAPPLVDVAACAGTSVALWHAELQRQLVRLDRARAVIAETEALRFRAITWSATQQRPSRLRVGGRYYEQQSKHHDKNIS